MKTKISLSGGYHDRSEISVVINIKAEALLDYANGQTSAKELIENYASPYQLKRLQRHFCGVMRCACGSWRRADIDTKGINDSAEVIRQLHQNGFLLWML